MAAANLAERTPKEWFREAERTYTEKHQGCPWCEGSYRVFCQRRETNVIFYCQACDFQASHDGQTDSFKIVAGIKDRERAIPETMCETPKTMVSSSSAKRTRL